MPFDPDAVEVVSFDSYSTLVDVRAAEGALAEHVSNPAAVSRLWRTRSIEYAMVSNAIDAYEPFSDLLRMALDHALAVHGADPPAAAREAILGVYHQLDVFGDVREGLAALDRAGYAVYVLSNGDPDLLDSLLAHADIEDVVVDAISADEVATYKPAPGLYRHAADRMDTPIERIAHVSAGWLDVQGAVHAGMQGVWLDREGRPWDPFDGEPDLVVDSITGLADRLPAREP